MPSPNVASISFVPAHLNRLDCAERRKKGKRGNDRMSQTITKETDEGFVRAQ